MTTHLVFTLPGINNSGPRHWQSVWERVHSGVLRIEQREWNRPSSAEWIEKIEASVAKQPVAPILVAHSLGCIAAVQWMARTRLSIHALILVAIPDPAGKQFPINTTGFALLPERLYHDRLAIISSENDRYASPEFSDGCAHRWRAMHINAGLKGHLNEATALDDWPFGWSIVEAWNT